MLGMMSGVEGLETGDDDDGGDRQKMMRAL